MVNKLYNIVRELLNSGVLCADVDIKNDELCYSLNGFAKSGKGFLYIDDGNIYLETRYNQIDLIESVEDVVRVAYNWDKDYSYSANYPTTNFLTETNNWYVLYKRYNFIQ